MKGFVGMPVVLSPKIKPIANDLLVNALNTRNVSFRSNIDDDDDFDEFEKKSEEENTVDENNDLTNEEKDDENAENKTTKVSKGEPSVIDTVYLSVKNFVADKYNYGKQQFQKFWDKTYGKVITVLSGFIGLASIIGARGIVKKNKMTRKTLKEIFSGESIDAISENAEDIIEKLTETVKNALTFNLKELGKTPSHIKDIVKSSSQMLADIFYKGRKKLEEGAEEVLDATDPIRLLSQTVQQQEKLINTLLEHIKGNKENSESLLKEMKEIQKTLTPQAVASMETVQLLDRLNKEAYALLKRLNPDCEPTVEQINKCVTDILKAAKKHSAGTN